MPHPTDEHPRKRPYQPSIDSYFTTSLSPSPPPSTTTPISAFTSNPPHFSTHLPPPTQSNALQSTLLHLGMRIRKAVPGGYQLCERKDSLLSHYPPVPISATTDAGAGCAGTGVKRGLQPYCSVPTYSGIPTYSGVPTSYSSGAAYTTLLTRTDPAPEEEDESLPELVFTGVDSLEESENGWPSSQESSSSVATVSTPHSIASEFVARGGAGKKRLYGEIEDETERESEEVRLDDCGWGDEMEAEMEDGEQWRGGREIRVPVAAKRDVGGWRKWDGRVWGGDEARGEWW